MRHRDLKKMCSRQYKVLFVNVGSCVYIFAEALNKLVL